MSLAELAEQMHGWLTDDYKAVIFEYVASEHEAPSLAYALYRYDPGYVYIRHFFVVREYRASGVGRAAIRLLLNDILPKDIPKRLEVLVNNERGSAFWKAVGFREYSVIMESLPG